MYSVKPIINTNSDDYCLLCNEVNFGIKLSTSMKNLLFYALILHVQFILA